MQNILQGSAHLFSGRKQSLEQTQINGIFGLASFSLNMCKLIGEHQVREVTGEGVAGSYTVADHICTYHGSSSFGKP